MSSAINDRGKEREGTERGGKEVGRRVKEGEGEGLADETARHGLGLVSELARWC